MRRPDLKALWGAQSEQRQSQEQQALARQAMLRQAADRWDRQQYEQQYPRQYVQPWDPTPGDSVSFASGSTVTWVTGTYRFGTPIHYWSSTGVSEPAMDPDLVMDIGL